MNHSFVSIKGAREHYLKNISLDLPLHKLIVVTGVSGSGKSSLVFDTIYREGRRRYLEFISTQFREFIEIQSRPEVDSIEGLPPVFFIGSGRSRSLSRATVATLTEIQDFLRILFSRAGDMHCHQCRRLLKKYTAHEIVDEIVRLNRLVYILAPLPPKTSLSWLKKEGFIRVRTHDGIMDIDKIKDADRVLEVVIDRVEAGVSERLRISESVDLALRYGAGAVTVSESGAKTDSLYFTDYRCQECGLVFGEMTTGSFSFNSPYGACAKCGGLGRDADTLEDCKFCGGSRLSPAALSSYVGEANLLDLGKMEVKDFGDFFQKLSFPDERRESVRKQIWQSIQPRVQRLADFGIGYLKLNQAADCLSEGELQRLKLASHMASGLVGVLYILDEPTAGLHPADMDQLIYLLKELRDQGNTLLVVEHERRIYESADWIVELGPEAGRRGGELIAEGPLEKIRQTAESVTRKVLNHDFLKTGKVSKDRKIADNFIQIQGASLHNLKNINVNIPLNVLCCVTGVSGSGKSSLILEVLYRASQNLELAKRRKNPGFKAIKGLEKVLQWILVDSQIVGKSSRSILATYSGIFEHIRKLFTQVPESRVRGYQADRFSFNEKSGRCEACEGQGIQYVDLVYLPDLEMTCEICKGARFNRETLEVKYKGRNIAGILSLTVDEAKDFFKNIPAIHQKLECLQEIGLGYLALGQGLTTLSNGETQRMKLASELFGRAKGQIAYVLEEPSKCLHAADIQKLMKVLFKLRDQGNTVIVIEHSVDIIFNSDYVIDMGPGSGTQGGEVIAFGTPEEIMKNEKSKTGFYLKSLSSHLKS
jgi:excinuclease ABC subunit A